ncbi:hypothetical protein H0E87_026962, partial [Populus deltoides]
VVAGDREKAREEEPRRAIVFGREARSRCGAGLRVSGRSRLGNQRGSETLPMGEGDAAAGGLGFGGGRLTEKAASGAGEEWPREGNGQELGGKGESLLLFPRFFQREGPPRLVWGLPKWRGGKGDGCRNGR